MSYKLFLSDIDDTLIKMGTSDISSSSINKLKKIIDSGIKFVPCTGRPLPLVPKQLIELGIEYAIFANGGGIYSYKDNQYVYDTYINPETTYKLVKMCEEFDSLVSAFYGDEVVSDSRYIDRILSDPRHKTLRLRRIEDNFHENIIKNNYKIRKITLDTKAELKEEYSNLIKDNFKDLNITSFSDKSIEVTIKGADKGSALKYLANKLNIKTSECIYAGDNDNDIPALSIVGYAIAPSNASNEAKENAHVVSESYETDGVLNEVLKKISF